MSSMQLPIKTTLIATIMLLTVAAGPAPAADGPFPPGTSRHPATEGRAAFTLHLPGEGAGERPDLVVLLHETGCTDGDVGDLAAVLSRENNVAVLCPQAAGLGFADADADLEPIERTVQHVKGLLSSENVHLVGIRDSARQAVLYGFARPKLFRSVVGLGADVPRVRPPSAASSLRVLVLKGADDRPAAGRESVARIREDVEVAEFRQLIGDVRMPDPASRQYMTHFQNAAAGKATAGLDLNLKWRELAPGLAERSRRKARALVYLYDDSPGGRQRTRQIQNEVLFDAAVREAAKDVVPIMVHRDKVHEVAPNLKIQAGPVLLVLDEDGKVVGFVQRRPTAKALIALLNS